MKKKIELDEKQICEEYQNSREGVGSLCKKYHVGKIRIKEILKKHNIEFKKRGKQELNEDFVVNDWKIEKYPEVEGKHYILRDKRTEFTTKDIKNSSGIVTTHIEKEYGVETPPLYYRRKYYMKTGNYWWEQWFDVMLVDNKETKKCPYCDWETIDINNRSGMFETHLLRQHNIDKKTYLKEYPEDKSFFLGANPRVNRQMETDTDNFVVCEICGKKLGRIDGQHLKIHNMTKFEYIQKFGYKNLVSVKYHNKMVESVNIANLNMTFTRNSKSELEIKDFIESGGLECTTNRKILNGKEIDIFIPSKNIGIEYNGNKWHTEWFGGKNKNYHLSKLEECKNKGVDLISVFEDEYENHKDIVLSKIAHILNIKNKNLPRIYGRKCKIKEVYSFQAEEFLNKFHIQGFVKSTVFIGAFYQDKLIAVMSFLNQKNNWELTRFASDINYICCGVGGKLFKYFTKHYNYYEIKSFADRRWTLDEKDNIYTKLGFELNEIVKPSYTYYNPSIDRYKRFHKFNFRKKRLLKLHTELNPMMTETEMAKELGYDRIWDCGLLKYVYKNPDL